MRQAAALVVIWAALLTSMLAFLGLAFTLRPRLQQAQGLGVLTWMSIAWCVLSTVTAALLHSIAGEAGAEALKGRTLRIISYGLLESGALFAGLSHLVSPLDYGIYGALVPMAAMLALRPQAN